MTVSNAAMDNDRVPSLYYPPRARWYSKLWRPWYALKRRLRLDAIPSPFDQPVYKLVMGIVVPGLSFRLYGQPLVGWLVMVGYGLAALVFVIWIGYRPSTVALTAMISIHASSILHMQRRSLADMQLWLRIAWSVVLFVVVSACIYAPLCGQLERRWFLPLRIGERVYVIRTSAVPRLVRRGDWVAYRIMAQDWGQHGAAVRIGEGYAIGQVLAVAGDKISFSGNGVSVNQELLPQQRYMPAQGNMTVAEGSWFIWPDVAILERGNAQAAVTADAMKQLATVRESEFVGIPFRRWWWRKQPVP